MFVIRRVGKVAAILATLFLSAIVAPPLSAAAPDGGSDSVPVERSDGSGRWFNIDATDSRARREGDELNSDSATPASFVRYMELLGSPIEHPILGGNRASFFLTRDWLFVEVYGVDPMEDFDVRQTRAYKGATHGWEWMQCLPKRGAERIPSDTDRISYLRQWFRFHRMGRLVFVIPLCLEDVPAGERAGAVHASERFLEVMKSYSPRRLEDLERERAAADMLFALVTNRRHELRKEASELLTQISTRERARLQKLDPEFEGALDYILVGRPREEEEERRWAAEEAAWIAINYPREIVPELAIAPVGLPHVIVSLVNRSDSPVWALVYPGMLSRDFCNVNFKIWPPGAAQALHYRPYGNVPCPSVIADSMLLQPGDSISAGYDLSEVLTDSGLFRIQAVVAYGHAQSNILEIFLPTLTRGEAQHRSVDLANAEYQTRFRSYPYPKSGAALFEEDEGRLVRDTGSWLWIGEKQISESASHFLTANARVTIFDDERRPVVDVTMTILDRFSGRTTTFADYGEMWSWSELVDTIR